MKKLHSDCSKMEYETSVEAGLDMLNFEEIVTKYSFLVVKIANHLMGRLSGKACKDDLIQAGMLGLIEAAKKFNSEKGASFETYAGIRIRGSMIDELRKGDWAPRSVHRNSRRISEAIRNVENKLVRIAKDTEIAEELGVSIDKYYQMLQDSLGSRLFSLSDLMDEDGGFSNSNMSKNTSEPFTDVVKQALISNLSKAIDDLPDREKLVLALYYDEELNLKEIGKILGVSESRVSQIHSQAALRLKSRLKSWQD